jgi:hypothetical protein
MNIFDILYTLLVVACVAIMIVWTFEVSDSLNQDSKKPDKMGSVHMLAAWGLSFSGVMFAAIYFLSFMLNMNVSVFAVPVCTTMVSTIFSYKIGKCFKISATLLGLSVAASIASVALYIFR